VIKGVLLITLLAMVPAQAASVLVTVTGVHNAKGHVRVAVCGRADFLQPHCPYTAKASATPGSVLVVVPDVPPGSYAAQAFHDENDNGVIDRNIFGIPTEGLGFSNNAKMFFGPPRFDAASFPVTDPTTKITFSIRYF
jgi:uncharacterized protein (DUF2141 family)